MKSAETRQPAQILALFTLAYLVRLAGVAWGLPLIFHPDEPFIADHAVKILRTGDPNPHWFLYPDLWIYVHVGLAKIATLLGGPCDGFYVEGRCIQAIGGMSLLYLAGRSLSALLGALTVLVLYRIGKQLWGHPAGMVAAAFLAFSPEHVRQSQWMTTDVGAGFLVTLVLRFALEGRTTLAGAFAGLAAATKYNAGLSVLIPLAFAVREKRGARALLETSVPCLLTFVAAMPWIVLDAPAVLAALSEQAAHYAAGHLGADGDPWRIYLLHFLSDAPTLFVTAAAGWILLAREERRLTCALLAFPLAYYLLFCSVKITVARNMMPILPVLFLGAGYAAHRGRAAWPVIAFALLPPLATIAARTHAISLPDPRLVSQRWMESAIEPGARIVCEFYGPALRAPRFTAVTVSELARFPLEEYVKQDIDYVVASSGTHERYFTWPDRAPAKTRFYDRLFTEWTELRRFEPQAPGAGPTIRILRRPVGPAPGRLVPAPSAG